VTDDACRECLGHGGMTCDWCGGSGAAAGADPVCEEWWDRCPTCGGSGWLPCGCASVEELRDNEREKKGPPGSAA
jgi:DnaJ-class molecular chaperone